VFKRKLLNELTDFKKVLYTSFNLIFLHARHPLTLRQTKQRRQQMHKYRLSCLQKMKVWVY